MDQLMVVPEKEPLNGCVCVSAYLHLGSLLREFWWITVQVWDLFYNANSVRDMIKQKIQEESLRTYLFSYSSIYDSLSLDILASMFELDKSVVHSIVSKMIINEELMVTSHLHMCALITLTEVAGIRHIYYWYRYSTLY